MPIVTLYGDMTVDFADVLLLSDLGAITLLLVLVYIEKITSGIQQLAVLVRPTVFLNAMTRLLREAR